jgi:type IV pilus assembly protein PilM
VSRRTRSLLGLDIGSSSVKAVELTKHGDRLALTGCGRAAIGSSDKVEDAILQALEAANARSTRAVTAVSGRSVIVRYVPMMQMPDEEMKQAIEYEADKYIPFDVSEVVLDCTRLPEQAQGEQMKVLLVAVKRTLIEEHIAILNNVNLTPMIIDVDVFALGNAFELRCNRMGVDDTTVRALVDIGSSKTCINIMRGMTSYFTREIYIAGNDLTDAVARRFGESPEDVEHMKKDPGGAQEAMQDAMLSVLEDIGAEIRLSFDYYENQFDADVKEVYLSGGSVKFPGMDTVLGQIFNIDTFLWDPTEGLDIQTTGTLEGSNADLAVAVGLASRLAGM